ncbi:serine hydrolase [Pedobacter sp. FW305-3-2-15-E-R2A2]|uniref:serine hydrolase n=1 Tax=Pedobacter sp. FW305-3-2-15-E-R2A2 TaxID=3140251 RepID=UPI0031405F00
MAAKIFLRIITFCVFLLLNSDMAFSQISLDSVYSILKKEIDHKRSKSIIVGIVDSNGRHIISAGVLSDKDRRLPDGNTEYEIGSVTKVITSLMLADMSLKKKLDLSDPLLKFLPKYVKPLDKNVRDISLLNLATHTAGLPRFPDNNEPKDLENPYADYTVGQLYEYLSRFEPNRVPGTQFQYSNTGYSLLGQVLINVSGKDYESLVKEQIFSPLKMNSTVITLTPALKSNMAIGHNEYGAAVSGWDMPAVASNGALRSNVNDMLTFVSANLGLIKTDLYPAMELSHRKQTRKGNDDAFITLGWTLFDHDGKEILLKDGSTAGYSSLIAIDKKKNRGIVVLANSKNEIKNIAYHILDSTFALKPYTYKWRLLDTLNSVAKRKGVDAAIALYRQLSTLEKSEFVFDEVSLIYAGNELRKANKPDDAIKMYKFNLTVYPNSTETYENLADLYRRTGNVKMAIASYEQLLKIDPKNASGIWMLRQLKDASAVR